MWSRCARQAARSTAIADFARRVDPKLVNKRAFENLARAGAFDSLNPNRRQLVENSDRILGGAQRSRSASAKADRSSLFGGGGARPKNCA